MGFRPWLDKYNLIGGQPWKVEISKAIKSSDIALVLFSRISVSKKGYVQKEFKLIIDIMDESPEGDISAVPIKLDNCELPDRFKAFQAINLYESGGYTKIEEAIKYNNSTSNNYENKLSNLVIQKERLMLKISNKKSPAAIAAYKKEFRQLSREIDNIELMLAEESKSMFIAHSHRDRHIARTIEEIAVSDFNFNISNMPNKLYGEPNNITKVIHNRIRKSSTIIGILSPDKEILSTDGLRKRKYMPSNWVMHEISIAISMDKIIHLLVHESIHDSFYLKIIPYNIHTKFGNHNFKDISSEVISIINSRYEKNISQ